VQPRKPRSLQGMIGVQPMATLEILALWFISVPFGDLA
jgi:hypothetical protein